MLVYSNSNVCTFSASVSFGLCCRYQPALIVFIYSPSFSESRQIAHNTNYKSIDGKIGDIIMMSCCAYYMYHAPTHTCIYVYAGIPNKLFKAANIPWVSKGRGN